MDAISIAKGYLEAHLLLTATLGICSALSLFSKKRPASLRPSEVLWLAYALVGASFVLPFFFHAAPFRLQAPLQVWSAPSFRQLVPAARFSAVSISAATGASVKPSLFSAAWMVWLLAGALFTGFGFSARRLWCGRVSLRRVMDESFLIRGLRGVRILASEQEREAYSFRIFRRLYVVVPAKLLERQPEYRIVLLHELQHHRQGDTLAAYGLELLKAFFFVNPGVHRLVDRISRLQEFACDEKLVDRKHVSPQAYGRCLIWAAEHGLGAHPLFAGTTGMAVSTSGLQLKRRIDMMFIERKSKSGKWMSRFLGTAAIVALATTAYASQGLIKDRRITLAEAQQMAKVATEGSTFPIVVNAAVLEQLNNFVGTPDGRAYLRDAIANQQAYRAMIAEKIDAYELPKELQAIPVIESKYRNYKPTGQHGAGLWMFIASSAQHYGLQVNGNVDDRLNPELETDAAMRYLDGNYLRFQDWLLAILAYNAGENQVQKGIDATGSRDAWKLVEAGYDGDKNYLAMVMASVIILKNPALLN